mgnify:FL=1|tara:strand:- start:30 stop:698 length:669 start_codon:yes stop_codon:yes gene_type:complete
MLKKFIRSSFGRLIFSWIISLIIYFLSNSIKWRELTPENKENALKSNLPIIVVFWHERIAVMSKIWPRKRPLAMLQSPHADGKLIAQAINHLGFQTVWGSTNRNAVGGILGLVRKAKKGVSIGITPDGPRGPALICSSGPIALAKATGLQVIPIAWSTSKFWKLSNWDQSIVPKPFSKGVWVWGKPIKVNKNVNKNKIRELTNQLSIELQNTTKIADNFFGH